MNRHAEGVRGRGVRLDKSRKCGLQPMRIEDIIGSVVTNEEAMEP